MKVLTVLIRNKGGVGRSNREIAREMENKGHTMDILSREDDLNTYSLFKSIFPIRKKVMEMNKKSNYDIIYTQDYSCAIPLLFPYRIFKDKHFCCFCGIKKGNHPKLFQKHHKMTQILIGNMMGKRLIVIGDGLKERFPKAKLIYRGVNLEEFRPLNLERDNLGWTLTHTSNEMVSEEGMRRVAKETGLNLLIAKDIPQREMNNFYNRCKVFTNIPRTAGFNLSWLEAMSSGVPIIIGNNEGAGAFLPIEKVDTSKDIEKQIIEIIKNPKEIDYREWLIKNGFGWEDTTEELIEFFKKRKKKKRSKILSLIKSGKTLKDKINIVLWLLTKKTRKDILIENPIGKFHFPEGYGRIWESSVYDYEGEEILSLMEEEGTFIDVGANIGKYSLAMSKKAKKIISIEPDRKNFSVLKKNVELNNLKDVILENIALSNKEGLVNLYLGKDEGKHSLVRETNQIEKVKSMMLDNLVEKHRIKDITSIKIDVEGAEVKVVEGSLGTINKFAPKLIIEIQDRDNLEKIKHLLKGYNCSRICDSNYLFKKDI